MPSANKLQAALYASIASEFQTALCVLLEWTTSSAWYAFGKQAWSSALLCHLRINFKQHLCPFWTSLKQRFNMPSANKLQAALYASIANKFQTALGVHERTTTSAWYAFCKPASSGYCKQISSSIWCTLYFENKLQAALDISLRIRRGCDCPLKCGTYTWFRRSKRTGNTSQWYWIVFFCGYSRWRSSWALPV